jgi:hypothetical protein
MSSSIVYRGLTFTDGAGPYLLQQHEGLVGLPALETNDKSPVGRHGVRFGLTWRRERIVDLELIVLGWSEAELNTAVADLVDALGDVQGTYPLELTVPGVARGQAVELLVQAREFAAPYTIETEEGHAAEAAVQLVAADSYYRSVVEHVATLSVAQAVVGRTYPRTYPYTYPDAGSGGVASLVNAGTAPSLPTLRIFGPVADPAIENQTTGRRVSFDVDLVVGTWLDVAWSQGEAMSVLLNGTASRYSTLVESDVLELAPGANSVRYSANAATTSYVEVRWRDRWK